jgi:hypothetical protein
MVNLFGFGWSEMTDHTKNSQETSRNCEQEPVAAAIAAWVPLLQALGCLNCWPLIATEQGFIGIEWD